MRFPVFVLAFLLGGFVQATDYYVSPSGNDSNNGTSPSTPWKTINRVNQSTFSFQPGDRVLFQRGGTWRGEVILGSSGNASQPVTLGAYGTGDKPMIKGSALATGWTQYQGNIWMANVASLVTQVYVNGERMTPARFPNNGWLRNSNQMGPTQMHSNDLNQPNGYWNGAMAVVRTSSSSFDTLTIANYANGNLTFTTPVYYIMGTEPWGFYITGKLAVLDAPGEWYYDKAQKRLYLWAPGGVDPNNLTVEAAIHRNGVNCYWQRHHLAIENIAFKHQQYAGVLNDGALNVTVENCDFSELYHGIRCAGSNNNYHHNTFRDTYASGVAAFGENTTIANSTFSRIAVLDGQGETAWGYFGIRTTGMGAVIRNNQLDTIGYIGIIAESNALVEKNIVRHPLAVMNDGGGIAIDHADGLVIQDNIVSDPIGSWANGAPPQAPHNERMGIGIYFGNTSVKNTTAQRNTVYNCPQTGIHVDHTAVTTGIQIKDNILFNNGVQLAMSDYSSAVHVPAFNDVYSGNIMYSLDKDQTCMLQYHCHSATPVNFGSFSNNHYYNPYNEMSIRTINFIDGYQNRQFTLERWQQERNTDAGSTRSPIRLPDHEVLQELSSNLVINGDFTEHVNGWTGWPTNAEVSHVTTHLDNGALKAYLPDNSMYPTFGLHNPDLFPVQNQAWYRVRVSLQSDAEGEVVVGVKGQSQFSGPYSIWNRKVPFGPERRDLEMFFQSTLTDQAQIDFVNPWTDPMYYLDNVEVTRVNVVPLDPHERHKLLVNEADEAQSFPIPGGCWRSIDGTLLTGSITVPAHSSMVIYMDEGPECGMPEPGGQVRVKMYLAGAMRPGEVLMADDLRGHGLVPSSEPYSAMGYSVENAGATVSPSVMEDNGAQSVVDWVLVQLHEDNAGYSLLASRAALLLRNGTVVDPQGNALLNFNLPVVGRHIAVRHRNHLGTLCTEAVESNGDQVDFTRYNLPVYGTDAMALVDERRALWAGAVVASGTVKYTGENNDRDPILAEVGGLIPTNVVFGYLPEDVNLDGFVTYTGSGNDREMVLQSIGGVNSTAVRTEAMP